MSRPNWIGQTLGGRYQIQELIGQGGMSSVFKAMDPNLQRIVAVKMVHPHLSNDPRFTSRFEEEARAVARLRHPNIVQVYDFNHDGDDYYMVQELIPGETLQSILTRVNSTGAYLPIRDAIQYGIEICSAIGYAHQLGLIHRDIKPANIMIDERGRAILMDFGIVKLLEGQAHTTTGAMVGTVLYMSPDLIRGEAPDARSDIYSLGVTLFEMFSGRPPFEAQSAMTLMMMHQNDPIPDLRQLRSEVPLDLSAIVEKSLSKARADRFSTAGEMGAELQRVLDRLNSSQPALIHSLDPKEYPGEDQSISTTSSSDVSTRRISQGSGDTSQSRAASNGSTAGKPTKLVSPTLIKNSSTGAVNLPAKQAPQKRTNLAPILAGGGFIGILLFIACLLAAGIALRNTLADNGNGLFQAFAGSTATSTLNEITPSKNDDVQTPSPATTLTSQGGGVQTSVPSDRQFVQIDQVTLNDQGQYEVGYETFQFTEQFPGDHIHFFFNTAKKDSAGLPEKGAYQMYSGPRPFTGFSADSRPENASQLCALVASSDHLAQLGSGNCILLPDVTTITANGVSSCRFGPGDEYPEVASLKQGATAIVDGISPDESWWYVKNPGLEGSFCWILASTTTLEGDISSLALVQPPPMPLKTPSPETPRVTINRITLGPQNQYLVEYVAENFVEKLPGTHIHFFFDTTPADQTGIEGSGERLMYGGPSPFSGYSASDRPTEAVKICALVANPDHTIDIDSGSCFDLPNLPPGFISLQTSCYEKPDESSNLVQELIQGIDIRILGISADNNWFYVRRNIIPIQSCWVPKTGVVANGDTSQLPKINLNPTPTAKNETQPKDYGY